MTEKKVIDDIYCFIASDPKGEGICGFSSPIGFMPMVAADKKRVDSLMEIAQSISDNSNMNISLVKFEKRTLLETITPKGGSNDHTKSNLH